jgi:hypothetical protein
MRGLFGPASWRVAAAVLRVSQRQVDYLLAEDPKNPAQPTLPQLIRLERWSARLPEMLEAWRLESIAVINAEAERRKLEISDAVTRLKLLKIARVKRDAERERERANKKLQRKARIRAERGY